MAIRTTVQVLREMALIKSQVKDEAARAALLKPLEDELQAFIDAASRQGELPGIESKDAKGKK